MPLTPDPDDGMLPADEVSPFPSELAAAVEATPEPEPDPLPTEFDPRCREDLSGLLYLGALSHQFSAFGHRFKIRTLTTDELLEVGLLQREYRDTIGESKAYVTAIVGAALVSVDGKTPVQPLGPKDSEIAARFEYVRTGWFPWVVDEVYEEYVKLDARALEVLTKMGKSVAPDGSIDPWLNRQIRLADRRGIFQRPQLSPVQELSLIILMDSDEIQTFLNEQRELSKAIKISLITNDPMRLPMLFPMYATKEQTDNAAALMAMENDEPVEIISDVPMEDVLGVLRSLHGGTLDLSALEAYGDG